MNKRFVVECKNCDRVLSIEEVENKAGFCHSCYSKSRINTETYRQLRYGQPDSLNLDLSNGKSNNPPKNPSR